MARLTLSVLVLALAGAGAWEAATRITDRIEADTAARARAALAAEGGMGWARVSADGLVLRLTGTAPDEVARFRALGSVAGGLDDRRIDDQMRVAARALLEPPAFSLELMRQGQAVSLIGLMPERTNRDRLAARLAGGGVDVTDLTSSAAFPAPPDWTPALDYAIAAALALEQGTVSVMPGQVRITGNAATPADKTRIEAALTAARPDGITVETAISAPLPVIARYALRLSRQGGQARLETCAAETPAARDRILAAARAAGAAPGPEDCRLGIGAPPGWEQAVLAALSHATTGTLDILDGTVRVTLPPDTTDEAMAALQDDLAPALPTGFTLGLARAEPAPDDSPAHFTAETGSSGPARIEGVITDETMRQTVQSLARAQLGPVEGELRLDPSTPEGWPLRVLAGLDAMSTLDRARLEVTQDRIALTGISGDPAAAERAILALANRLGPGAEYALSIAYDRRLDPDIAHPDGTECVDRLNTVMLVSEIGFEPASARIAGDIAPVLDEMAAIMRDCADYRIELAGHTDSQGSADSNLRLSHDRAGAVLDAMREAGLPVSNITADGYGATRPIAENDTEEGREANRRIEMTLISPEPVAVPLPVSDIATGRTPTPEAAEHALMARLSDLPAPVIGLPAPLFGTDRLATPPRIEPPAEVIEATPDTPRPPFRPDTETPQEAPQ
ncbi:MAG: OmpA family protein [Paracoccus sp. (in: a-proteobacteria)]|nr:OmpA family protein [Paracoccus sp. (in: a-proteobacteria)]